MGEKDKKDRVIQLDKGIIIDIVPNVEYDFDTSIIDQMNTIVKSIIEQVSMMQTTTMKLAKNSYEKRAKMLMEINTMQLNPQAQYFLI